MKKTLYLILKIFIITHFYPNVILSQTAGDIAFVGFNTDGNDEFAFTTLIDIPANTSIWFTDNEWDGVDRFNNINEGELEWSHTAMLPTGSIVVIAGNGGGSATIVSGLGSVSGSGVNLSPSNETLYALLSEPIADAMMISPNFLTGISNDLLGDGVGDLSNTGLIIGINFIDFANDLDGFKFLGNTYGQTNFSNYLPKIMNTSNWQIEPSDGNLTLDGGTFDIDDFSIINLTWNGSANDNDWTNINNWTPMITPSTTSDISIPNGLTSYPTINSTTTAKGITIESSASLIANATITGDITYKRELSTNWHLISSPVSGETIENLIANHTFATGSESNIGLAPYDNNSISPWEYQTLASEGIFNNKGYAVLLATAGDISFTGTANSTAINQSIMVGSESAFNLVGNPYTSYINSTTFFNDNSSFLTEQTIWLWNGVQYITHNMNTPIEISPTQGFFIEAASDNNVIFSTSNQSHQNTTTFMREEPSANFELFITSNGKSSSTKVFYVEGKTIGFDNGYDSKMFNGTSYDFAVFTELAADNQGDNLAIQTVALDNTTVIPVGIIAKAGDEITFSIESLNLPNDTSVYLENNITGTFINLSEDSYKTTLENNTNNIGQFYIHTSAKSLSTKDITNNLNNVSIYKSSKTQVTIAGLNADASVSVFSLLGKQIVNTKISANTLNIINLPTLSTGVYIIKVNSKLGEVTKKITLN